MLASLLLLAAHATAGPLGELDAAGLAAALAERGGGNAVVLLTDGRTVTTDASVKDLDAYAEGVKKSDVRYVPGAVVLAYATTLPDGPMFRIAKLTKPGPVRKLTAVPLPEDAVKSGKITFANALGTKLDMTRLENSKGWTVPLSISSAFTDALASGDDVALNVKDLDEVEFLRALAKALGGRFQQTGKAYRIEPIGAELKNRALATIARAGKNPAVGGEANYQNGGAFITEMNNDESSEGDVRFTVALDAPQSTRGKDKNAAPAPATIPARLDFARLATQAASPADFEKLMAREKDSIVLPLGGNSALQNAVIKIIEVQANDPASIQRARALISSVNPQNPGVVRLEFGYGAQAALNTLDRRGRAIRTIILRVL